MTLDVDGGSYQGDFDGIAGGWVYLIERDEGPMAFPLESVSGVTFEGPDELVEWKRATTSLTITVPKN